ncbi:ABC transporter ATP-binding protein [Acrocarpospora macrocephala]|uniref:Multidrug ABC transporter permease n=1 Tax=Acrocarpospora macrocephala TaxID=150177 RepID=A0A5M3WJ76_9ACTN|nr:ABC transporter ATP-binding protein [Acrocarpospora macrocephala]GES08410.1 multidrug ABC transporter permease [Acrocarpospora macrocephala]
MRSPGTGAALLAVGSLVWQAGPVLATAQLAGAIIGGAAPVALAWLTKLLIDRLTMGSGPSPLVLALLLAVAGGVLALLPHLTGFVQAEQQRRIVRRTSDELFTAVSRITGLARLEDPEFRDRLQLAQQSGQATPQIVVNALLSLLSGAVTLVGFAGAVSTFSLWLTLVVAAAAVPDVIVQLRLSRARTRMMWEIAPLERRRIFYQLLLLDLQAAKEIRLFGISGFLRGRMLAELDAGQRAERRVDTVAVRRNGALTLLAAVVAGGALISMVAQIGAGRAGVGDLAVLTAAVAGVLSCLSSMTVQLGQLQQALTLVHHYEHVVRAQADLPEPAPAGVVATLRRGIEVRDVWFRYGSGLPWVLSGLSLTIPYGKAVALVGLNGAGKSTLVKLLCRLYDPDRGGIHWDGADVRDLPVDGLRRRIGAVFQDFVAYDLTAAENIAIGDLTALDSSESFGRIQVAASQAGVHEALAGLPLGYETVLSRFFAAGPGDEAGQGVLLSGGQWQRVAIARALLRAESADLLILDEPSSGLDPDAEYAIAEQLRAGRAGRTSLLISHRLNTVRQADHIIVLAKGKVAEEGTHDQLMALGGEYARLFTRQAAGFQEPAALH